MTSSPADRSSADGGAAARAPLGRSNAQLKRLRRLATRRDERDRAGLVVVEGPTLVAEVLASGAAVDHVFHEVGRFDDLAGRAREAGVPVDAVAEDVLASLLTTVTPQPVVALVRRAVARLDDVVGAAAARGRPMLVLGGVADPGNAGTLLRSAEAAGVAGVALTEESVDPFSPKVVRASAGAVLRLPVAVQVAVADLVAAAAAAGLPLVGTASDGGRAPEDADLAGPFALVLGSESHGMPSTLAASLDELVAIPMEGRTESLNVGVAGAAVLFEAARQRRVDDRGPGAAQLVSRASHELRSPLAAVQGFSGVLVNRWDRLDDEKRRTMVADIHREAQRLARMVGEVLDLSRVEAGRLHLDRRPLDLRALVDAAVERVQADHPTLVVAIEVAGDLPRPLGDAERIGRLVANLLENAAKYGEGVDVTVTARAGDGHVALVVADGGPGMGPDEVERAFRPAPGDAPGRPSGAGIGLWLARAIAEAHGATFALDSTPGRGTRATLTLPTAPQ